MPFPAPSTAIPVFDHVVVVLLENHGYADIIGSSNAPYINSLASGGASFTNSHGVTHPSFPNYFAFFCGNTLVSNDTCPPPGWPYSNANLGSLLLAAGKTFTGYAEGLPPGITSCSNTAKTYAGRHVPWTWFKNVPATCTKDFSQFPQTASGFSGLPTVSIVVPDLQHDMHSFGTETATQEITNGDTWLKQFIDSYAQWAGSHNSLLILQWDEDHGSLTSDPTGNQIPTIFYGANVTQGGQFSENINHYSVLATLCQMYSLAPPGNAATATPVTDCWNAAPPVTYGTQPGWGGYVWNYPTGLTGITATFTVPSFTGLYPGSVISIWVGLGNVQQIGIYCTYDTSKPGSNASRPWTFFLPGPEDWQEASYPVAAGDSLTTAISFDDNFWYASITSHTRHWSYEEKRSHRAVLAGGAFPGTYMYPEGTAEVIIEKEATDLPNYGSVTFTNISLTPAVNVTPVAIHTVNATTDQEPGAYSNGSFAMNWMAYS